MREKRISFGQGKGSLTHNNREFVADNVDGSVLPIISLSCVSRLAKHTIGFSRNQPSVIMLNRNVMTARFTAATMSIFLE